MDTTQNPPKSCFAACGPGGGAWPDEATVHRAWDLPDGAVLWLPPPAGGQPVPQQAPHDPGAAAAVPPAVPPAESDTG